jgi:hypothetical protein
VAVVLGLLIISYASSVRTYLGQRAEIAGVEASIAASQQQISSAQERIEQWSDPAYVELQARERYDLVLPGDHLYLVVGDPAAAKPTTVVAPSVGGAKVTVPQDPTWWSRVAGSVGAAGSANTPPTTATPPTPTTPTATPTTAPSTSASTDAGR